MNLLKSLQKPDAHILDVGVGSGYLSAAMARMNPSAKVYGIDYYNDLVQLANENLSKQVCRMFFMFSHCDSSNSTHHVGQGLA